MNPNNCGSIPLEQYHGVPAGWSKEEIIEQHRKLGGTFLIDGNDATEPGAPGFLPDRYNWLQYRQTLYRVCNGVRENDEACIELAIRYIELNYMGSYSGFIREKLARTLKNVALSTSAAQRLIEHFETLVKEKKCYQEFAEYKKLLNKINAGNKDG